MIMVLRSFVVTVIALGLMTTMAKAQTVATLSTQAAAGGTTVNRDILIEAIGRALEAHGDGSADAAITIDGDATFVMPPGNHGGINVDIVSYEATPGRYSAVIHTGDNRADGPRLEVSGQAAPTMEVPVPMRPIMNGQVIQASDLSMQRVDVQRAGKFTVADSSQIIGKTAKRALSALQPIRITDIGSTYLVLKNNTVNVRVVSGHINLMMQGKALDDGARGDNIRVLNTRSNKIIEGVVISAGNVSVAIDAPLASN